MGDTVSFAERWQPTFLDRVLEQSAAFFEQVVLDVLQAIGYGGSRSHAAERLGRTGDEGIDAVIREDKLGPEDEPPRHRRPPHEPYCKPSASSATLMTSARAHELPTAPVRRECTRQQPPRLRSAEVVDRHSPAAVGRGHEREWRRPSRVRLGPGIGVPMLIVRSNTNMCSHDRRDRRGRRRLGTTGLEMTAKTAKHPFRQRTAEARSVVPRFHAPRTAKPASDRLSPRFGKKRLAAKGSLHRSRRKPAARRNTSAATVGDNPSMTAAIFGLVGVIVGGVLNGLVSYWLERQREQRAVRAAARLLMDPLQAIDGELDLVFATREWSVLRHKELEAVDALWLQHRGLLASHNAPLDDWQAVGGAFQAVRALYTWTRDQVDAGTRALVDDGPLGRAAMDGILEDNRARIHAGRLVLERLARD